MDAHRLAEERSIAMHRAIAAKIRRDATIVDRACRRVDTWLIDGTVHPKYASEWRTLLDLPLDELCERLVAGDERMRALRQCTPFAGALDPRERWAIRRSVTG